MSSPFIIMYQNALSVKTECNSLVEVSLRRIRNIGPEVHPIKRVDTLSKFMNSLRTSGYDHGYRFHILRGISIIALR